MAQPKHSPFFCEPIQLVCWLSGLKICYHVAKAEHLFIKCRAFEKHVFILFSLFLPELGVIMSSVAASGADDRPRRPVGIRNSDKGCKLEDLEGGK